MMWLLQVKLLIIAVRSKLVYPNANRYLRGAWFFTMLLFSFSFVFSQEASEVVVLRVDEREVTLSEFMARYNESVEKNALEFAYQWTDELLKVKVARSKRMDTLFVLQNEMNTYMSHRQKQLLIDSVLLKQGINQQDEIMASLSSGTSYLIAQIYKRLPQNVSLSLLAEQMQQMDSVWQHIQNGGSFWGCVQSFSDEKDTLCMMKEEMYQEMENVLITLLPGEVSKPFLTPVGIHIVKLLRRDVSPSYEKQSLSSVALRNATSQMLDSLKNTYRFCLNKDALNELLQKGKTAKILFLLDDKPYSGDDFYYFAISYPAGIRRQWEAFVEKTIWDYANFRLLDNSPSYTWKMLWLEEQLLSEMIDNSLRMEVPDEGMLNYYFESNRSKYAWESPRYRGAVISANSKRTLRRVRKFLKTLPMEEWEDAVRLLFNEKSGEQVKIEVGLYAMGEHPYLDEKIFKQGKSEVLPTHPYRVLLGKEIKMPDNLSLVRETVVRDYMESYKKVWLGELREKSKVEINQEVLKTVNND